MYRVLILVILAAALTGCASNSSDGVFSSVFSNLDAEGRPLPPEGAGVSRRLSGQDAESFKGVSDTGSGQFVSGRAPYTPETNKAGQTEYRLNLVDAPIASAVKNVLGDILGLNYTIDPRVRGSITLQTSQPVGRNALVDILETTLAANGFAIVKASSSYNVVPLSEALATTPGVSVPAVAMRTPGLKVQVVELNYISAEEMRTILAPISRDGSILRVDNARNYIMIAGSNPDLAAMRDAIQVFDVDWMKGMSVALHPLKTSRPDAVAKELETIFRAQEGPGTNLIKFVPNERLNSVLVITSRPQYLARAEAWIRQLDRLASTSEAQLFVYPIQNRSADEMAKVLQSVLSGKSGDPLESTPSVSPDLQPEQIASDPANPTAPSAPGPASALGGNGAPSVVADVENNSLLISTTARNYEKIERILRQLDVLPIQVMLEAVIAEVTLTDELKFGVRWFFENGDFSIGFSDLVSGGTGASFPGMAWSFASKSLEFTLNALSSVTNVKVISSPTLMALNNQKATLQIGDQVPIVTRTSTGVENPDAPVISTITLKDTGIILNVTPRVNASGRVLLDIQQEASSVVKTTSSGIDSPTIQQRKVQTRVTVNDGEALIIGGLIQERKSKQTGKIPVLGDIPVVGNAFKNKTDTIERTELVIFIRPKIVRNVEEARSVNDEFRKRLDFGASDTPANRIKRDLKRLQ
jgi:general secretion pathway protein D